MKTKKWCDINKLSINMKKTNLMIIKSVKKRTAQSLLILIQNNDGTSQSLERKHCIKYLRVMINEFLTWNYHISFVCSRISRNTGLIAKLRHCLSIQQLKQVYCNLIYPYFSYSLLVLGSAYKTYTSKIQV